MNILEARRRTLGAGVYKKTVQGNPVSVRSLARMRPGLKVFGRSEQESTTGAQLLNKSASGQSLGVSWQIDGSKVTFEGTTNDNGGSKVYAQVSMLPDMEIGKTYYAKSFTDVITTQFEVVKSSGNDYTDAVTLDGTETRINFRAIVDGSGGQNGMEVNLTAYVAVTENKNMTQWEPYTGGKPSPNPDYPQEIESVGDDGNIGVDVYGGNLWDEQWRNGYYNISTGEYIQNVLSFCNVNPIKVQPSSQYYASFMPNGVSDNIYIQMYTDDMEYIRQININSRLFMTDSNAGYINFNVPTDYTEYDNDIIISREAIPYEPYKQPQTLTVQTPNGLPGIPVTSGGNYTDSTGQQWVCDEVDFRRGKYVQRVKKEYLTGTPNFQKSSGSVKHKWSNALTNSYKSGNSAVLSTFGIYSAWANPIEGNEVICIDGHNLYWSTPTEMTAEEANTKFSKMIASDNPPYVIGQLETPIETDLTPEQMQQYEAIHTNHPTTTVVNDAGCHMLLTYKTKKSLEVTD